MELFEQKIITVITAVRPDLKGIRNLTSLVNLHFDPQLYPEVLRKLLHGQTTDLPEKLLDGESFRELLHAYSFLDANNTRYLSTFYDSDALEQDPQVIDIIEWQDGN